MRLLPEENEVLGTWTFDGQKMLADDACERIEKLTSQVLERLAFSKDYGAWETLYRDPVDGRLWERIYPQGELNGGGPPALRIISLDDARKKYGPIV